MYLSPEKTALALPLPLTQRGQIRDRKMATEKLPTTSPGARQARLPSHGSWTMKAFFLKILPFNFPSLLCLVLEWSITFLFCLAQLLSLCFSVHLSLSNFLFLSLALSLPHSPERERERRLPGLGELALIFGGYNRMRVCLWLGGRLW